MNNSFLSGWRWTRGDTKEKVEIKPAILAKEVRGKAEKHEARRRRWMGGHGRDKGQMVPICSLPVKVDDNACISGRRWCCLHKVGQGS